MSFEGIRKIYLLIFFSNSGNYWNINTYWSINTEVCYFDAISTIKIKSVAVASRLTF